jgi:Uma2 family endonuclease
MGQTFPPKWWLDYDAECARVDEWGEYAPKPRAVDTDPPKQPQWAIELLPPADPLADIQRAIDAKRQLIASLGIPLELLRP